MATRPRPRIRGRAVAGTFVPLVIIIAVCASCGGSTPTTPNPTPTPISTVDPCGVIALRAKSLPILNGTGCSQIDTTPVVMLRITESNGGSALCSATVIASDALLTAAHCVHDASAVSVYVMQGATPIAATSFAAIPSFRPDFSTESPDVGVVITAQPIGRRIVPILTSRDATVGEPGVIAGYGGDVGGTNALRAANITVASMDAFYLFSQYSGGTTGSVCPGDSGGPLLLKQDGTWAIAGVTSARTAQACADVSQSSYARITNAQIKAFILGQVPNAKGI